MEVEWSKLSSLSNHFYVGGTYFAHLSINSSNQLITYDVDLSYHLDIRHIETHVKQNPLGQQGMVFIGNDGGVSKAVETALELSFVDLSNYGLNITQYYGIGIPHDGNPTIVGGTQDGDFSTYRDGTWSADFGDAAEAVFDYSNSDICYVVQFCVNDNYFFRKTTDNGVTWDLIGWDLPQNEVRNDAPLEMSNIDPNTILVGGLHVWKTTDGGNNFTELPSQFTSSDVTRLKTIRFAPSDNRIIYAAYEMPIWGQGGIGSYVRLIRSTDGGQNWANILPYNYNSFNLVDCGIFDLAVDYNNPYIFYITLDRNSANKKVYKGVGSQGTNVINWTNLSSGLLNLPVNCIELVRGSTINEMFVGTDDGVYYKNDLLEHWVPFGDGLPIISVSDLEIDYVNNQLIISTFGRGIYKTDLCGFIPISGNIIVTGTQVWNDKRVPENVIVQNGATLTINGTVWMNEAYNIIVEVGGHLIIEGGTVTNTCPNTFWGGIVVKGTNNQPQNLLYQGMLTLSKGCIKNAGIGIHTCNTTLPPPMRSGGGIIAADRSKFINNFVGVQMEKYYSNQMAYFNLCEFSVDNKFPEGFEFKEFVRLNEVSNIRFTGCAFENSITVGSDLTRTGIGIYSNMSHFLVNGYCNAYNQNQCVDYEPSKFNSLDYGIYVLGTSAKTFSVQNSEFYINHTGIYSSAVLNPLIKKNTFEVYAYYGQYGCGLYLDGCSGYTVEGNIFKISYTSDPYDNTWGIVINNSGVENNMIYKDIFSGLEYGISAQDINRSWDGNTGLRFKCNDFSITKYDIAVLRSVEERGYGVATAQGSRGTCEDPAGNLFSNLQSYQGYYGILNNHDEANFNDMEYFHHEPNSNSRVRPSNYTNSTVVLNNTNINFTPACCPSHQSGGGGTIDEKSLSEKSEATEVSSDLSLLIDEGNTPDKVLEVSSIYPEESIEVTEDLVQIAPFVSDSVISTVINREDLYNNAMIRDIMVANPHSAKSEDLMLKLDMRQDTMPHYMRNEILEGIDTLSIRELMEIQSQIGMANYKYGLDRMISHNFNDTLVLGIDSINILLDQDASFSSKIMKAWLKFENGDRQWAINYLDSIPSQLALSEIQTSELSWQNEYMEWLSTDPVIDSSSLAQLNYFLGSTSLNVSARARGLMVANNLLTYNEPYLLPQELQSSKIEYIKKSDRKALDYIKVFPNPAKDFITIEYKVGSCKNKADILIFDETGKIITRFKTDKSLDQTIITTRNLNTGNYYIQLTSDGKALASGRFTIIK